MKILSLFDGMSCAAFAFQSLDCKPVIFSSEVDKFCLQVSKKNFPDQIRLGDVRNVKGCELPKIDILIGGSPCQGFSTQGAGKAFDDHRSNLFWEYVRILDEVKPRWFILENVKMAKRHRDVISKAVGVEPILINGALLTAHNRPRLYWTNIPVGQPVNNWLVFADIMETGENIEKVHHGKFTYRQWCQQSLPGMSNKIIVSGIYEPNKFKKNRWVYSPFGKFPCLDASEAHPKIDAGGLSWRLITCIEAERLQGVPDDATAGVSRRQRLKMLGNGFCVPVIAHILKGIV